MLGHISNVLGTRNARSGYMTMSEMSYRRGPSETHSTAI